MEKHQNRLTTKGKTLWLVLLIGWFVLSDRFAYLIKFPWSLFPILGTLIPLIVLPIVMKKVSKKHSEDEHDETITLISQKQKKVRGRGRGRGVPDLEEILNKQSKKEGSNQGEESSTYRPKIVIKDKKTSSRKEKSIINDGGKSRKFKTRY